jgi:hypothetical protein
MKEIVENGREQTVKTNSHNGKVHGAGVLEKLQKHSLGPIWNPKAHYCVRTRPPLGFLLSSMNSVRKFTNCFLEINLSNILSSTSRFLPFGVLNFYHSNAYYLHWPFHLH